MRLISGHLKNFRSHASSELVFPEGVVGILGDNESGKSSVTEFVEFMFYGGKAIRGTKEGLRWHGAPARHTAGGDLSVEIGGVVYDITRTETTAYVKVNGVKEAEGTDPVNGYMEERIGRTLDEFRSSVLTRQKDVAKIASMLPVERVAFIRSVLGMSKIDAGLKACRKRKSALSQEIEGLKAGLGEREPLAAALDQAQGGLFNAEHAANVASRKYEEANRAQTLASAALGVSADVEAEFSAASRNIEREMGKIQQLDNGIGDLETDLTNAQGAHERVLKAKPDLDKLPRLRKENGDLREAASKQAARGILDLRRDQLYAEIDSLQEQVGDAKARVAAFDPEALAAANTVAGAADKKLEALRDKRLALVAQAEASRQAAQSIVASLQVQAQKVLNLSKDGDCPTCTQKLGDHFEVVLGSLQDRLRRSQETINDIDNDLPELKYPSDEEIESEVIRDDLEKEVERLNQLQKDAEQAGAQVAHSRGRLVQAETDLLTCLTEIDNLPTVEVDTDRLREVSAEIERLEALDASLAMDRGLAASIPTIEERLTLATAQRTEAIADLEIATNCFAEISFDPQAHKTLQEDAERARKARENARVEAARADEAHKGAVATVKTAERAIKDYDLRGEHLSLIEAQHLTHERCAARLADFRVAVAATIRPEMEELMSGYVHLLTDGRHEAVELSEDFEATLYESGVPMEVVSGGCEDIAALAMRLAISQMISERAGHPLSLLILDEPFGSQDEVRRANLLTLIRQLGGIFKQCIVISHVPETKDAVDHVVELVFSEAEGRTRVVA